MRKILYLVLAALAVYVGWLFWSEGEVPSVMQYVENQDLVTLEARYTPESIMEKHRQELIPTASYAYQEPKLKYYPYLLIEAKYTQSDKKSREGYLLWGLVDGEIILDTQTWEKTHGFGDAIRAQATRTDFKILHAIAKHEGTCTRDQLQRELHLEADTLEPWIKSTCQKHLVVESGPELQIHLEDPKILVSPQTKLLHNFVKKPHRYGQCYAKNFSRAQIENIAQAAFGSSFTIRKVTEIFLPIYEITVLNPDGSLSISNWNALNGQKERGVI